ncbi:MAG: hypothetical protein O9302_00655 [Cyclobacteriaceae bacterium]|jgi:hypothetical protein|nr:hypothetical protein [Cytophagales bacterium]MCZ8326539.1 hypothetical protein [Cyclobacteriaceae bacterium]
MNWPRVLLFLFFLSGLNTSVWAQDDENEQDGKKKRASILDDTTKQIYGPKSTRYYTERTIFLNRFESSTIDTVIRNFHQFTFINRLNQEYQDLGNIGTAMSPIYYQLPQTIGVSSGFNAYNVYWDLDTMRYFDTHSPYSNMQVILGGKGRSITRVVYTRNIKPNWNFGFNYVTLNIDKQIQRQGKGDRNVRSTYYDLFMTYHTKDSAYWIFANARRMRHTVIENGGVQVDDTFTFSDFFSQFAQPELTTAETRDIRIATHMYQQYRIWKTWQVYHQFDKQRQYNAFLESNPTNSYYDPRIINGTTAGDRNWFRTTRNELGLKGNIGQVLLNGYWATRRYEMDYEHIAERRLPIQTKGTEYYAGGTLAYQYKKGFTFLAEAQALLRSNYKIGVGLETPWLEGSLVRAQYKPTFVQQAYIGEFDGWLNSFRDIEVNQLKGFAKLPLKGLKASAGVTLTTLNNYVFFNLNEEATKQKVLPQQSNGNQIMQSPEFRLQWQFIRKKFTLDARALYTSVLENSNNAIQVPEWLLHGQLAYQNIFFDGNFDIQLGVEARWQSAYFGNGYDVPTQQFYTQQQFRNNDYLLLDTFFNWKMKRGRIFVRYHNILQALQGTGYFSTPFYPAQSNVLDFGFDWSFYD